MGDLKLNQRLLNKACCYSKKRASKTEAFCDRDVLLGSFPEMKYDTSWYHGAFFLSIKCSITFSENRFFKVTGIVNLYKTKIYELTIISYFISKNDSNTLPQNSIKLILYHISFQRTMDLYIDHTF